MGGFEILTTSEMSRADRTAVDAGVPSLTLMENAGRAVAAQTESMVRPNGSIAVLAGPGNNGGDGYVAARVLREKGFDVRIASLGDPERLRGDAGIMAGRWRGGIEPLSGARLGETDILIDALFGAGLSRPLTGVAAAAVEAANASGRPILAVDVPSGLDGTTGVALGPVIKADKTVTFFRLKPGHLLMPGRSLCGDIEVADIGIPESVLNAIRPLTYANRPELWLNSYPWPRIDGHKYSRGHALVVSGPASSTGAARLGARAALRVGAGLVTVASPQDAVPINAANLTAIMVQPFDNPRGLGTMLTDTRKNAVLIGPGSGVGDATRAMVREVLASSAAAVLDADALTSFAGDDHKRLKTALEKYGRKPIVITPHSGEFERVFGVERDDANRPTGTKLDEARRVAREYRLTVVLKGADTVIADPDGRAAINDNAPPYLATAGAGDVLAGLITGLLAQGMPTFEAACAAVWLHGECARQFGPGLIAEDLPEVLPRILKDLQFRS